jgi:hypothetical protein
MFVLQITILSALLVENYFADETKAVSASQVPHKGGIL